LEAFVAAGAGFLLAVLWFDLMFDVQALRHRDGGAEDALASVSRYYRRVTTTARPMNLLVGAVMAATLAAIVVQIAGGDGPGWVGWASLALAVPAIAVAGIHTFPAAVRLGAATDPIPVQLQIARSIGRDHVACLVAMSAVLVIQLGFAR
jgi:hypothetical protein